MHSGTTHPRLPLVPTHSTWQERQLRGTTNCKRRHSMLFCGDLSATECCELRSHGSQFYNVIELLVVCQNWHIGQYCPPLPRPHDLPRLGQVLMPSTHLRASSPSVVARCRTPLGLSCSPPFHTAPQWCRIEPQLARCAHGKKNKTRTSDSGC